MRLRSLLIITSIAFYGTSFTVKAQTVPNDKENAKAFVQKFYDWYIPLASIPPDKQTECSCTVVLKKHPEYFEPALLKALKDDYDAQKKAKGEIVGLDSDPFLNAQDTGWEYKTGNVKQNGDKYSVNVHILENGNLRKPVLTSEIIIIPELTKLNGNWVFSNFIYPGEGKEKSFNLRQLLANLKKDRVKYAKK